MNYSAEMRKQMAQTGEAMPDGGYPIKNRADLENAIQAFGRANDKPEVKAHIMKRAKALGCEECIPADWTSKDAASTIAYMTDTFMLDDVRRTKDGYLSAFARVARTGIQTYLGDEVGRPDMDQVRVYRPESEVFSADSLKTYTHRPITFKHPQVSVDSSNWKRFAVGQTGDEVLRDGTFVRVPMVLMDQDTIDAYEKDGVRELSMGYTAELKWTPGMTTDGQPYDAVQTAIRANHLAVVPRARGGDALRIGDYHREGTEVMTKQITVDGLPVQVADERDAAVVTKHIDELTGKIKKHKDHSEELDKQLKDAKTASDTEIAGLKKQVETKDGELAVLKKQVEDAKVTPVKLDALVAERQSVVDKAKSILGDKYEFAGKELGQIRKDAVTAKLGDGAKALTTDAAIEGAFAALTVDVKGTNGTGTVVTDGNARLAAAIAISGSHSGSDAKSTALAERDKQLQDAWKGDRKTA